MKRIYLTVVVIFLLSFQSVLSQSSYVITDTSTLLGVSFVETGDKNNAQFVWIKDIDRVKRYSPKDIIEYRLESGKVYVSKYISDKAVFLERIRKGKATLYYYADKGSEAYFLEKDSSVFVKIPKEKEPFKAMIYEHTADFEWGKDQLRLVKYRRQSLARLFDIYNAGSRNSFSYTRFGVVAGYSRLNLAISQDVENESLKGVSFNPSSSVLIGVFADIPIRMSDFSFNIGVSFAKNSFTSNLRTAGFDVDALVEISTVEVPILIRYTLPTIKWRPFVNFGRTNSYHTQNDNELRRANFSQNTVVLQNADKKKFVPKSIHGYSMGVGLQRRLNYRKVVSAEFRYSHFSRAENAVSKNEFNVLIGFSF